MNDIINPPVSSNGRLFKFDTQCEISIHDISRDGKNDIHQQKVPGMFAQCIHY